MVFINAVFDFLHSALRAFHLGRKPFAKAPTGRHKDQDRADGGRGHVEQCAREGREQKATRERRDGRAGQAESNDHHIGQHKDSHGCKVVRITERQQSLAVVAQGFKGEIVAQGKGSDCGHHKNCNQGQALGQSGLWGFTHI